ncbi:MAG: AsnC family transcriptional regulator [Nitrospirota bacterium]
MLSIDSIDREILNILQSDFPITDTPFLSIARKTNITEDAVIERIRRLKYEKIIRQVSAIFDTRSLGYESSLVAAEIPADNIDKGVEVINKHPGVSHNYLRNDIYNIWFTIAVPPNSSLGLEKSVKILTENAGAVRFLLLPALRLFKIRFTLDMNDNEDIDVGRSSLSNIKSEKLSDNHSITEEDILFIRMLQKDMPIVRYPFEELAKGYKVEPQTVVKRLDEFIKKGTMRRFAAVLNHQRSGYNVNAMGVWIVPKPSIESVAEQMTSFKAVSHCYLRPTYPDWPYNIFTMVHSRSQKELDAIFLNISTTTGIKEYRRLYTNKEFKKIRLQYFTPNLEEWERDIVNNE